MTTNPIPIPLAAGDGLEETPSGKMSSEWLDAVFDLCMENPKFVNECWEQGSGQQFTAAEFALLATMQGVGPEEAAKRLTGETE